MQLGVKAEKSEQHDSKGGADGRAQALTYYTQAITLYDEAIMREEAREATLSNGVSLESPMRTEAFYGTGWAIIPVLSVIMANLLTWSPKWPTDQAF